MPKLNITAEVVIELQDESPNRNARIEIKTTDTLLGLYEAVTVSQKDADGKTYPIIIFREIPIVEGSPLESTY
ncbi:MAG: hypothetical protein WC668_00515 [Patescibacteria group bacterium]|jgi:predicted Zn-dependent protease with MMP-like domain